MWSRRNVAPVLFLQINGLDASDLLQKLTKFDYWNRTKKASEAKFSFVNDDRKLLEDPRFLPNSQWSFRFGFLEDISKIIPMQVRSVEPNYGSKVTVEITCFDAAMNLSRFSSGRNWGRIPSSVVAEKIAKAHGLGFVADPSKDTPPKAWIQPHDQSDLKFLRERAVEIDFEVFVDGSPPVLHYRKKAYDAAPVNVLTYADDPSEYSYVLSFKPKVKSLGPLSSGAASSGGSGSGTLIPASNDRSSSLGGYLVDLEARSGGLTVRPTNSDRPSLVKGGSSASNPALLASASRQQMLDKVSEADSKHPLTPSLRARNTHEWAGLEKQLAGKWYITEAHHSIDGKGSSTECQWKRNAAGAGTDKSKNPNNKTSGPGDNTRRTVVGPGGKLTVVDGFR